MYYYRRLDGKAKLRTSFPADDCFELDDNWKPCSWFQFYLPWLFPMRDSRGVP